MLTLFIMNLMLFNRITSYNVCYTKLLRAEGLIIEDEKIQTQYKKLSGATFTGQKIDLSQFEKPKKKKEDNKKDFKKGHNVITSYSIHYTKLYEIKILSVG